MTKATFSVHSMLTWKNLFFWIVTVNIQDYNTALINQFLISNNHRALVAKIMTTPMQHSSVSV